MFIRTQPGVFVKRDQPSGSTLCEAEAGRHQVILTNITVGTDFYILMGTPPEAPAAGNFDFILKAGEPGVVIDNYTGMIQCDPPAGAGEINVSRLFGSKYRATRA